MQSNSKRHAQQTWNVLAFMLLLAAYALLIVWGDSLEKRIVLLLVALVIRSAIESESPKT